MSLCGRLVYFLFLLLFLWGRAYTQTYEGKVVAVSDGDTLIVLTPEKRQVKVRLAQIDAPEKSQAYGQRSKQSLSDLVFGKQVRVEQQDRDRYGRVAGRVYAGGLDVNAEQVKRGMAWVYRKYARARHCLLSSMRRSMPSVTCGLTHMPYRLGNTVMASSALALPRFKKREQRRNQRFQSNLVAVLNVTARR
jgi:Staphylococcal nuclease homologue